MGNFRISDFLGPNSIEPGGTPSRLVGVRWLPTPGFPPCQAGLKTRLYRNCVLAGSLEPGGRRSQYFGWLGSTVSIQARIPPFRLRTSVKPTVLRKSCALALRPPI